MMQQLFLKRTLRLAGPAGLLLHPRGNTAGSWLPNDRSAPRRVGPSSVFHLKREKLLYFSAFQKSAAEKPSWRLRILAQSRPSKQRIRLPYFPRWGNWDLERIRDPFQASTESARIRTRIWGSCQLGCCVFGVFLGICQVYFQNLPLM